MTRRRKIAAAILGIVVAASAFFAYKAFTDESPPDVSDLVIERPEIPPEENAFTYIMQADRAASAVIPSLRSSVMEPDPADVASAVAAHASVFPYIDKALACTQFQFPPEAVRWPGVGFENAEFTTSYLVGLRAHEKFLKGQEDEAFRDILQLMQLEDRIRAAHGPLELGGFHGSEATSWIRRWLTDTTLPAASLKQLAAEVGRHPVRREDFAAALRAEYAMDAQIIDIIKHGDATPSGITTTTWGHLVGAPRSDYELKPNATKRMVAEALRIQSQAAALPWPEGNPRWRAWEEPLRKEGYAPILLPMFHDLRINGYGITYYLITSCRVRRAYTVHLSGADAINDLGMTQLLVALKAYKVEKGDLPERLEDLVPDYLAALPLDEFDGQPIKYDKAKKKLYTAVPDASAGNNRDLNDRHAWWWGYTTARRMPIPF